jgi:hypothetical protein
MMFERIGRMVVLRFVLELRYEMLLVYLYHSLASIWQLQRLFGHMNPFHVVLC